MYRSLNVTVSFYSPGRQIERFLQTGTIVKLSQNGRWL